MTGFDASKVSIFRPYPDEVPWDLLAAGGADEALVAAVVELNFLRVAKHAGRVTGAYGIRPRDATCFELVTLVVDPACRRRGLGRWLLGHAIGLAETKGAREIVTGRPGSRGAEAFLSRYGFEPIDRGLRLELTPE